MDCMQQCEAKIVLEKSKSLSASEVDDVVYLMGEFFPQNEIMIFAQILSPVETIKNRSFCRIDRNW